MKKKGMSKTDKATMPMKPMKKGKC